MTGEEAWNQAHSLVTLNLAEDRRACREIAFLDHDDTAIVALHLVHLVVDVLLLWAGEDDYDPSVLWQQVIGDRNTWRELFA